MSDAEPDAFERGRGHLDARGGSNSGFGIHALRRPEADIDDRSMGPQSYVVDRPWGRFEVLASNELVSVKLLSVAPGARLSLQRHRYRDELWHVLDDGLVVEVDGKDRPVAVGDRVWIPRGRAHRVYNAGTIEGRLVELAFGHFDEEDIERLADDYGRVTVWNSAR